jgi:rare lipoprotein A
MQTGKASVYSARFNNKRMANGEPVRGASDTAASRTLPLGSVAAVTNLQNGHSAVVKIRDRGPFRADRIIDVSPAVGQRLDIGKSGVVTVAVAPIKLAGR